MAVFGGAGSDVMVKAGPAGLLSLYVPGGSLKTVVAEAGWIAAARKLVLITAPTANLSERLSMRFFVDIKETSFIVAAADYD
ncbi:hypothetical protein [Kribbella sp. NPDC055071]